MHECQECGMYCDCDGEDMGQPQPKDCEHLQDGFHEENAEEDMMDEEDELLNILTHLIPDDFHNDKTICERVQLLVERIADLERQLALKDNP